MSDYKIHLKYNEKEVIIPCQRNDIIKDIITRYGIISKLPIDQFFFLYKDTKINQDQTFSQINEKDTEILVVVFPNKIKKSNYIKCFKCINPAIIEFFDNYSISLSDEKHGQKKIKLQDYISTQMIDLNKIKCSKCLNSIDNSENKFYYCFECENNFCVKCKSLHEEHKNIVDYSLKFFKCSQHHEQNFMSYCYDCKKNLCFFCTDQHKEHNIISFNNLFQKQNKNILKK